MRRYFSIQNNNLLQRSSPDSLNQLYRHGMRVSGRKPPVFSSKWLRLRNREAICNRQSVHLLVSPLIVCPKRRRRVLVGAVQRRLEQLLTEVITQQEWHLIELAMQPDHGHLFVRTNPFTFPSNMPRLIKGRSSRVLRKEFVQLRALPALWSPSSLLSTAGPVSSETTNALLSNKARTEILPASPAPNQGCPFIPGLERPGMNRPPFCKLIKNGASRYMNPEVMEEDTRKGCLYYLYRCRDTPCGCLPGSIIKNGARSTGPIPFGLCLDTSDAVGGLAEIAGDVLIQANVVNDDTRTGDAGDFAFQQVFHFDIRHIAVQADDVVFDQGGDVGRFRNHARFFQVFDNAVDVVQQFVFCDQEVHHVQHAGEIAQVPFDFLLLRFQFDLTVERENRAFALHKDLDRVRAPGGATDRDSLINHVFGFLKKLFSKRCRLAGNRRLAERPGIFSRLHFLLVGTLHGVFKCPAERADQHKWQADNDNPGSRIDNQKA